MARDVAAAAGVLGQWGRLYSVEAYAALLERDSRGRPSLAVNERVVETPEQHARVGTWAQALLEAGARFGLLSEAALR